MPFRRLRTPTLRVRRLVRFNLPHVGSASLTRSRCRLVAGVVKGSFPRVRRPMLGGRSRTCGAAGFGDLYVEVSRLNRNLLICKQGSRSHRIADHCSGGVHVGLPW